MTREEYVRYWTVHLLGLAWFATDAEERLAPCDLARARKDLPATVEGIVGRMFDQARRVGPQPADPVNNGRPQQPKVTP